MLIPLKLKYRTQTIDGGGKRAGSNNSTRKKRSILGHLNDAEKKRGRKG